MERSEVAPASLASLLGELVLLPTITFVALMAVVAARDKKYSSVKTVIDVMM